MTRGDFDSLLLEAVDEGLASLGDSAKYAVYFHLEKTFKLKKEDIPHEVEALTEALEKIFGFGANLLEILIMKKLYQKVGRSFKHSISENLQFNEYVEMARHSFRKQALTSRKKSMQRRKNRGLPK